MKTEDTRRLEDRELNQARSKPDTVNRPVRTALSLCTIIIVHNTVAQRQFSFIFPFLQTNITSQMWPSGGKGVIKILREAKVGVMLVSASGRTVDE